MRGPLSVFEFMRSALTHPVAGYYTKDRSRTLVPHSAGEASEEGIFGRKGDFITSPDISQMFGEIIAIYLVNLWMSCCQDGTPTPFRIIECGPGRGGLLADILRSMSAFPAMRASLRSITCVEASSPLRTAQAAALRVTTVASGGVQGAVHNVISRTEGGNGDGSNDTFVNWVDRMEDIAVEEDVATFILAHVSCDCRHMMARSCPPTEWIPVPCVFLLC